MAAVTAAAATGAPEPIRCRVSSAPSTNFPGSKAETEPYTDLLVSLQPPTDGLRPPTDVACVVDVSGSMRVRP